MNINRWHHGPQHMGAIHPDAIPITYDRIFRPKLVAHLYTLRGKAFLRKFYKSQHLAYNNGMRTLRGWVKSGFLGKSNEDFVKENLRQNRDDANRIFEFVKAHIGDLEPLYFNDRLTIYWEVNEAYLKILEWRHYKRRNINALCRSISSNNVLINGVNQIVMHMSTTQDHTSHGHVQNSPNLVDPLHMQDLRRHRCHATTQICTLCGEKGLDWHVELFGSIHELPLQVIAWRYNMQLSKSVEYIETPLLDKDVTFFGIGVFMRLLHSHHYETWEVKVIRLNANSNGFGSIFIPGENGKLVRDLDIGSIICIPSIYARKKGCNLQTIMVNDGIYPNERGFSKGASSNQKSKLGMGSKTFLEFMYDAINEPRYNTLEGFKEDMHHHTCDRDDLSRIEDSNGDLKGQSLEIEEDLRSETMLEDEYANEEDIEHHLNSPMHAMEVISGSIPVQEKDYFLHSPVQHVEIGEIFHNQNENENHFGDEVDVLSPMVDGFNSIKEPKKFASINHMMDVTTAKCQKQKRAKSTSKKTKVLQELQKKNVYNQTGRRHDFVSRSSRKIKKPSRFLDDINDKENNEKVNNKSIKKGEEAKISKVTRGEDKVSLVDMDDDEMESIALDAMGLYDVDEMYGGLYNVIKPLKSEHMNFFGDCSSRSEKSHLLQCYVTWIVEGGLVDASKPSRM